jgi:hypothetical protein
MGSTVGIGSVTRRLAFNPRCWPIRAVILCTAIAVGGAAAASWALDGADTKDQLRSRVLAPGGPRAFETQHAIIITDSESKARWADERLRQAVPNFMRVFGVYASYLNAIPKAQRRWTLPWMSTYFGSGDQAAVGPAGHHFDNDSGILHELNHLFFTASVIPSTRRFQYGGDAPDWLDEAVALAAETPQVKARRRLHFHEQVCAGRLVPLERFISQQHPLFGAPAMQKIISERRASGTGAPIMMTVGVDKLGLPRNSLLDFYSQSNAIAEFLVDSTGDPKVLMRVAHSIKDSTDQPGGQHQRWILDLAGKGDQPLPAQFDTWARAAASTGKASCAASAPQSRGSEGNS